MSITFKVEGIEEAEAEILRLAEEYPLALQRTANFIAQSTAQRARNKITTGFRTGRNYNGHRASAPGEPPANLSGDLAQSITHRKMTDRPGSVAEAGTNLDYGKTLELGGYVKTSPAFGSRLVFIEARPYLLPSFYEAVTMAEKKLKQEASKVG